MNFYEGTNNQGILQEIDRLCDTTDTSYTRVDKTSRVNIAMEELVSMIINSDGTWSFDDTNQTDLPVGTGNLVEGQETYSLPSFASGFLQIEMIEILALDGNHYRRIKPIDIKELPAKFGPDEFFGTDSSGNPLKGIPRVYDLQGDTLYLYPSPEAASVTLTAGLKIWFKRTSKDFTVATGTGDDTTEPGLPSTHHILLAYMGAVPYCMAYKKDRVPWLERKVEDMKKTLIEHYSHREKDKRKVMRPRRVLTRPYGGYYYY